MADKKNRTKKDKGTELIDIIMDIPFFEMLKADQLSIVAKHMIFFEIEEGEILFKEGAKGDSVCFVVDGILDVYKESSTPGQNVHLATIRKNRSIGEMAVVDEYTRSATVQAKEKASIVALTKGGFDAILTENPAIGIAILKKIARLLSMNLRSTSSRLADSLLPMA